MTMCRFAGITGMAVGLGIIALWLGLGQPSAALAQVPWPTPPPAPLGPFPQVIPSSQVKPVPAPARPGSFALQVDPIFAGLIPRIPPRPSTTVSSSETDPQLRVTLHVDAGATDRTLQLTYEPLPIDQVPNPATGQQVRRAFRLQTYDHVGSELAYSFRYPVRLTLRARDLELAAAGGDPARLRLAWFDPQRNRWQSLVTTYRLADATLLVRVMQPGLFALIASPPPVTQ